MKPQRSSNSRNHQKGRGGSGRVGAGRLTQDQSWAQAVIRDKTGRPLEPPSTAGSNRRVPH